MKVLVLGHNGMLGHMVHKYFNFMNISVDTIDDRWPSIEFKNYIESYNGDFIINCIGSIPQKTTSFNINYELPMWLDSNSKCNIVHPGTDCEIDLDNYGISKKIARDYILNNGKNTKILKASIIGPELKDRKSLFEWLLNTDLPVIQGWCRAYWNGVTTLEWSKQCKSLLSNWRAHPIENIIESNCISKYDLLTLISKVYNLNKTINKDDSIAINKCLKGNIKASDIKDQLKQLKQFYKH